MMKIDARTTLRVLVRDFLSACYPTPGPAFEYLRRDYGIFERLIGLERHRKRLVMRAAREAAAKAGLVGQSRELAEAVYAGLPRLTRTLMTGLYREAA